jgi:hypothetical protein
MARQRRETLIGGRRAAPAGHVLITGLVALSLATFLNAASLLKTAERQPYDSPIRGLTVGIMKPIVEISDFLQFDRPRQLVEMAIGRETGVTTTTMAPSITTTTVPGVTTTTLPSEVTTTTSATGLRQVTAAEPLVLYVTGDSFVEMVGDAFINDTAYISVVEVVSEDQTDWDFFRALTRPDSFDTPGFWEERIPEVQPDAAVVFYGGNDGQPIVWNGEYLEPDTEPWLDAYGVLVGEAMDTLVDSGVTRVYWMGMPIMSSDEFTQRVLGFNAVYAEEAAKRPEVTYVDVFYLFADENGQYSRYLRDESGDLINMRAADGNHYDWPGAYRLTDYVLGVIAEEWGFTDQL